MIDAHTAQAKGIILCADDFAFNQGVSSGIVALAEQGRISATSVMVLSPRWAGDAALLHDLRDRVDVGLHLDWTSDFAKASGHGRSLGMAMIRAASGAFGHGAAKVATRGVIERQLDAFERHWKAAPDFVDGHQHVQQFAGLREALVEILTSRYGCTGERSATRVGALPYLRISRAPAGQADFKARVIAAMGADALEKIAADAGLACSAALFGIHDFAGDGARYARLMARWMEAAPARCIIMCHPAQSAAADDPIGPARVREFSYLRGSDFAATLTRTGVKLVRGRSLARA